MRIKQWMDAAGLKITWLAEKLGVPYIRANRLYHEEVRPDLVEVDAIRRLSKKAVTFEDWLEAEKEKGNYQPPKKRRTNDAAKRSQ